MGKGVSFSREDMSLWVRYVEAATSPLRGQKSYDALPNLSDIRELSSKAV